jgi:uncharacterized protein (DUF433 family)
MAKTSPISVRLPPELMEEIEREARRTARPASRVIQSVLKEGVRIRRCPGIVFTAGPTGRRATVAGSGIDVWEVVRVYKSCKKDFKALSKALPQLSRPQLEAALYYYHCYPDEIDDRLKSEEEGYSELSSHPFVRRFRV